MDAHKIKSKEDLDGLLKADPQEDAQLEFKQVMDGLQRQHGDVESKRKKIEELAKDITAMANSAGGIIVYGVRENERTGQYDAPGMQRSDFLHEDDTWARFCDRFKNRLVNLMQQRTDPPVQYGITMFRQDESKDDSNFYVVLDVPAIDHGPHMVRGEGRNGFYTRDNNVCRQLTVAEITALMQRRQRGRESTDELDNDFTTETTERVSDLVRLPKDEPLFQQGLPRMIVGLFPSNEYRPAENSIVWASDLEVRNWQVRIERLGNWNQHTKTTIDGLLFPLVDESDIPYLGATSEHRFQRQPSGYIGMHKNGKFFFARRPHSDDETAVARMFRDRCDGPGIHGLYEREVIEALQQIRKLAHTSTRRPQYWTLYADMLNVQGYRLVLVNEDHRSDVLSGMVYSEPQTHQDLSFGPVRIRTLDAFENRAKAADQMRGFFNEVANAFGLQKSSQFSSRGTWAFQER